MKRGRRAFVVDALSLGLSGNLIMGCSHRHSPQANEPPEVVEFESMSALSERLWPPLSGASGPPVSLSERAATRELVRTLVRGMQVGASPTGALHQLARTAGFRLEQWRLAPHHWWALTEPTGPHRGLGGYLFRAGQRQPGRYLALHGPHSFYDVGTGAVALRLITSAGLAVQPDALFVNTRHRYAKFEGDPSSSRHPNDVCHRTDHIFNTVLSGLADAEPHLDVVQVHGFADREIVQEDRPQAVVAVVSPGAHERSASWAAAIAASMRRLWGEGVRLYPDEVRFLGAQTNVQGRLLRAYADARFAHIELAAAVRQREALEVARDLASAVAAARAQDMP